MSTHRPLLDGWELAAGGDGYSFDLWIRWDRLLSRWFWRLHPYDIGGQSLTRGMAIASGLVAIKSEKGT